MSFTITDVARILAERDLETHEMDDGRLVVVLRTENYQARDDTEKRMPVVFSLEEDFLLQLKTPNAFHVPDARQHAIATQCMVFQGADPLVRWCMDTSDGELTANIDLPLMDETPTGEQVFQALLALRTVVDRRYASLTELISGTGPVHPPSSTMTSVDKGMDSDRGFAGLRVRSTEEGMQERRDYLARWQCPSETYNGRLGITALIPSFISDLDRSCRKWSKAEIDFIGGLIKKQKAIPSLGWVPEQILQSAKDVWWLVPFCIWREDVASWVFVNKNGIWGPNPDTGENDISLIFSWDAVEEMQLEWEEDVVCTLTITTRDNENYLTFSEFVEDGYGSQLSIIQSIYQVFEPVIEASRDESIWHHGAGNERYVSFSAADQLLEETNWAGEGLAAQFSEGQNRGQDESGRGEAARVTEDESQADAATLDYSSHEGDLDLDDLTSAKGLKLPARLDGHLWLDGLTSAEGLVLPEYVGGRLCLSGLTTADGLVLSNYVGDNLSLSGLTSLDGLILPQRFGGLCLDGLTSAKGLKLPERLEGFLWLAGLTSAEGLVLPKHVGDTLRLDGLTSADTLVLPKHVGGVILSGLTNADGLVLPERLDGALNLSGLTSAERLVLPEYVGGFLILDGLTSADGLVLPKHVGGNLSLEGLTSAEGLVLPERVGGELSIGGEVVDPTSLSMASGEVEDVPENAFQDDGMAEGLKSPEKIEDGSGVADAESASSSTLSLSPTTPVAFIATVKQIHDTGSPQATTARKVLELFGAKRRGAQVVSLIEAALAQGHLTTFPDINTAPLDSPLELRLADGIAAGQYTLDTMGLASSSGETDSIDEVPSSPAKRAAQEPPRDGRKEKDPEKPDEEAVGSPEPADTGREFWAGRSSPASMEALDFVVEILCEKVPDVDLVYQKYRIHPRSGQHICRLIRLTPQKSALMIQLTMPETEYWSKRLGREGMNARYLERDGFYRLNATLESTRSHRLLWKEVLFHLWDVSTGTQDNDGDTQLGIGDRLRGLFRGQ